MYIQLNLTAIKINRFKVSNNDNLSEALENKSTEECRNFDLTNQNNVTK